jgi:adenylyltransferase/sulfurtransferase
MNPELTHEEMERYSRHILLPEIGVDGQRKMKAASVLIVGAGGLGSPLGLYLAAAGVGRIGLVDPDVVDTSNLQRQVIHSTGAKGMLKVDSARERMLQINPDIQVDTFPTTINSNNALDISEGYDILVDGTDNIPARYLLSDLAVLTGKPFVYGSIFRFEGQVSVFGLPGQPCYRCMFPTPPEPGTVPSCATAGVMGILPGTIGTLQATEVIKLITSKGKTLAGRLLIYDALDMSFDIVKIKRRSACPACGDHPTVTDLIDYQQFCGLGREVDAGLAGEGLDMDPLELAAALRDRQDILVIDIREGAELTLAKRDGAIHIPQAELRSRLDELAGHGQVVLFCRHGIRSARLVKELHDGGMESIRNLSGGINAWIDQVDPDQVHY